MDATLSGDQDDRGALPPRPTTPCLHSRVGDGSGVAAARASSAHRSHFVDRSGRRFDAGGSGGGAPGGGADVASEDDGGPGMLPSRPTTPCMNRGSDGSRRKRSSSANRNGSFNAGPHTGSVGARMSELENALLTRAKVATALGAGALVVQSGMSRTSSHQVADGTFNSGLLGISAGGAGVGPATATLVGALKGSSGCGNSSGGGSREVRPSSSSGRGAGPSTANHPPRPSSSCGYHAGDAGLSMADPVLVDQAIAMCKGARSNQVRAPAAVAQVAAGFQVPEYTELSPRHMAKRPSAPTPEQTNHWLQGISQSHDESPRDDNDAARTMQHNGRGRSSSHSPSSDGEECRADALLRPRSPTPTKMLAWEEPQEKPCGSAGDSDQEERGDQTDGLISRLIEACQMNEVNKAFAFYEKLHRMRVPLYEGVYKMIIECCMRTQQLGHAMQFYETLKGSGQRVSSRLVTVLIEACAREQHGDKVYTLWNDWCPTGAPVDGAQCEVLFETVGALIRTMSPDLAEDVLMDAMDRPGASHITRAPDAEIVLEELLQLNETVAHEARMNGTLMGELAGQFSKLHVVLEGLRKQSLQFAVAAHPVGSGNYGTYSGGGLGGSGGGASAASFASDGAGRFTISTDDLLMEDLDLDLELAAM